MKRLLIISILALLGMAQLAAQDDYEYVPFVREGVKWVYTYTNVDEPELGYSADPNLGYGTVYLTLELKGDTVINGKTYKAMHKYYGDAINTVNDTIPVYLREEDKVVYGIVPDGKTYPDCPIGNIYDYTLLNKMENGDEFILYNFQDPQAYWRYLFSPDMSETDFQEIFDDFVLQSTSFMNIGSHVVKCHTFGGFRMIEGIGVDGKSSVWFGYTLFPWTPIYAGVGYVHFRIRYVVENDEIIYKSVNYEGPKPTQDDYEYVPFVREGVKWVYSYTNEDVMDRPADPNLQYGTVYLTLELKGDTIINGKTYKAMHKYYGDAINTVNDTIPVYLREEDKVVYGIVPDGKTYPDCPIGRTFDSIIRDQIRNGEEFVLYDFQNPESFWNSIYDWEGGFELVSSDLIQIGAHLAKRYVCSGADDFIYIEGVGVDSRSFGYTLFPLKPIFVGSGDVKFEFRYLMEDDEIVYKGFHYEGTHDGIDEVVTDKQRCSNDPQYYNLMGQPVGKDVPTVPGIYIHQGRKICVSRTP